MMPGDAAAAIIHTGDGRYLLQHRDAIRSIFYPDHWGCFGGAMEAGESPLQALYRELREELAFDFEPHPTSKFGQFRFDVEAAKIPVFDRFYFDILINPAIVDELRLGEGAGMALVEGGKALHELRLVPYDGFALWLHCHQKMLVPSSLN